MSKQGLLIVVSGPSGAGKGTICQEYCKRHPEVFLSVSATTRAPRPGEQDGVHYFFYSKEEFQRMIREGELLEWAQYCQNYYGTPRKYVTQALEQGRDVILEIEVQGALHVQEQLEGGVYVFVLPPDPEVLASRLRGRNTEPEEVVRQRLNRAMSELVLMGNYDYVLENDSLEEAVDDLERIVRAERMSRRRRMAELEQKWNLTGIAKEQ